jgi:trigger factor
MFDWLKKSKENAPKGGTAVMEGEKETTLDLKVKVLERKACQAVLAVTVPADEVSRAIEEAYKDVQKRAKLPGFRPGKAPMEMIKKNFQGQAVEHGINNLLRESVHEALEREKIVALTVPSVDKVDYHDGKPLKYEVKVECPPEVVLKDYKGLAVVKKVRPVSDDDVAQRLDALRENNAKLAPSADESVGDKHFVLADYEAALDGVPVEGGKAQDQMIEVAAPQSITGFNEGLKGMKKGETKDVPIQFPADHPNKALAGKPVIFKVTVKDIKEKQLPAADDEFAKDLGMASLTELKDRLRQNLQAERTREERQEVEKQIIDGLLANHAFEVPPSLVQERAQRLTERLKEFMVRQGASEADWTANEPKMRERNMPEAEKQVRLSYLLTTIAEKESIEAADAEVDEAVRKAAEEVSADRVEELKKWYEERRENLRAQLKEEKIFKFLLDNARVTEPAA